MLDKGRPQKMNIKILSNEVCKSTSLMYIYAHTMYVLCTIANVPITVITNTISSEIYSPERYDCHRCLNLVNDII